MLRVSSNAVALRSQPPVALGQASSCPSPVWYVVGGAVAWALGGELFKDIFGLGTKAARHGIAHVEKKIPEPRRA